MSLWEDIDLYAIHMIEMNSKYQGLKKN